MNFFSMLMRLDRRWVYLLLVIVCLTAYYSDFTVPTIVEDETKAIYDFIEALEPGEIIFVAVDYDPSSQAELHPMTYALVEHAFRKDLKVIFTALSQNGPGMVDQAIRDLTDSLKLPKTYNGIFYEGKDIVNGIDYTFLGYKPYYAIVITAMGQDYRILFPSDYYGTPLDSIPMMRRVHNYDDIAIVVDISSGSITDAWISYGQGKFDFPLALGLTGVMTAQYYPFLQSKQVMGLMGGLLGAAQYEQLADNPGLAKDGMRVQLPAHLLIILFILIGNVGYLATRYKERKV
ncbi:MAG: hypothetical protein IIA17_06680 [candidate division Zixibacteria bacterium]|nr:hypothetical protein [candidate division Zixibacteria bacterium]